MTEGLIKKLGILAESAKYDVSCSSSGVSRRGAKGGIGNAAEWGVCHSFTDDGRCVSLLKILFTNHCIYDCAYCVNRRSNDVPRTGLTVAELVEVTLEFYRRNYIEGLFLSSGVVVGPDHTMERMVRALRELRRTHRFNGYIHMKVIPGADAELVRQAGLYADRLSVNVEIPLEAGLKRLAPEKDHQSVYAPMRVIRDGVEEYREDRRRLRHAPVFAPAGQSTQMIIGAAGECDKDVLRLSSRLYAGPALKRVYYSGYVPVNTDDARLPALREAPLVRENRLYQADWLMRLYQFDVEEICEGQAPDLELDIDPKLAWALRHPEFFPLDVNRAEYARLVRIPGVGLKSAERIVAARRHSRVTPELLKKMGVAMNRARWFIVEPGKLAFSVQEAGPAHVRRVLAAPKKAPPKAYQLSLFGGGGFPPQLPRQADIVAL